MTGLPTGTVTFLFTDVEGSTRLLQALGAEYPAVLERHGAIVRQALADHGGTEVSTEGDSFFVVFRSALDAVEAVARIQRELAAEEWPSGHSVRVRMGLHTGEGTLSRDDYVGLDVHRAARIAAAGHGGQVLLSGSTRGLVAGALPEGVGLRDLGAHKLKDLPQPEELWQLTVAGLKQDFPLIRTLGSPISLPAELTSFVGREREVAEAIALLEGTRLLTLTGPGGTGKTRLALRIASDVGARFRDGAAFADLAPLTDPALVGPTVARTLGLTDQAERPILEVLKAYLETREMLLVLDNFEHLLAGTAIVQELLATAPRLKILATSRSVLDLYGEHEFPVSPLRLPDASDVDDLGGLSANEAVSLFMDRARSAKPTFTLTPERARAIVEICRRLDGLPLAIELAASRVRLVEPAEILARLEAHLPVLTAGGSNVPGRLRTLRSTIEWSYDLLRSAEQSLFVRLAVFAGGWTLEAAEAVCDPEHELGPDTFELLAALVAQSLVRPVSSGGATRFDMLQTIREYARERLAQDDAEGRTQRRHLTFFRDLAETAEPHLVASEQAVWLDRLEAELDNLREALTRAHGERDTVDALRLAAALWRFWFQRGYLREGRATLEALLASASTVDPAIRAKGYTALGGLTYWLVDVEATQRAYEQAVALHRETGDREAEAQALYNVAFVPVMRGDNPAARGAFEASLALAREIGRTDLIVQSQHTLGMVMAVGGDPDAGLPLVEEALGSLLAAGDRTQAAWAFGEIGQVHRLRGDLGEARAAFLQALGLHAEVTNLPGISVTLEVIAAIESAAGRHADATRLKAAGQALRETTGASAPTMFSRPVDVVAAARLAIGDAAVDEALAEGRQMSLEEAVEFARRLRD